MVRFRSLPKFIVAHERRSSIAYLSLTRKRMLQVCSGLHLGISPRAVDSNYCLCLPRFSVYSILALRMH